jgi:hypothetical protein
MPSTQLTGLTHSGTSGNCEQPARARINAKAVNERRLNEEAVEDRVACDEAMDKAWPPRSLAICPFIPHMLPITGNGR